MIPKCPRCGGSVVRHLESDCVELRCLLCSRVVSVQPFPRKPRRDPGASARQVLELCYGRGLSTDDAARIVGVSRRTADRYLQQARKRASGMAS